MWSVVCCVLFVACGLMLVVVRCLLFVVCCLVFGARFWCLSFVVCSCASLLFVVGCWLLFIVPSCC